jgi:alkaline phosphatase D
MKKFRPTIAVLVCLITTAGLAQNGNPLSKKAPENAPAAAELEAFKPKPLDTTQNLAVIAFGSCNKTHMSQSIFNDIAANSPNLFIWLGDIIYADTTDVAAIATMYKNLKTEPEYRQVTKKTQVIGIYDDHDYGINDGGKDHPTKVGAKKALLDFLDVPNNAPVRKREGGYQSYMFGSGSQKIKIILLDTRYFRDSLAKDPSKQRRYLPNMEGDILGEAQWKWLEKELTNNTANLTLLCSSIQILPDEHPHEKWGNFPNARKRLLGLLVKTKPKNLMILSGDRHMAEITRMDLQGLPYPLYEFTSSGLTHVRTGTQEPNKYRVGDLIVERNFGLLRVHWINNQPVVTMQIRGVQNELLNNVIVKY